jgi:hypothetical protein
MAGAVCKYLLDQQQPPAHDIHHYRPAVAVWSNDAVQPSATRLASCSYKGATSSTYRMMLDVHEPFRQTTAERTYNGRALVDSKSIRSQTTQCFVWVHHVAQAARQMLLFLSRVETLCNESAWVVHGRNIIVAGWTMLRKIVPMLLPRCNLSVLRRTNAVMILSEDRRYSASPSRRFVASPH